MVVGYGFLALATWNARPLNGTKGFAPLTTTWPSEPP